MQNFITNHLSEIIAFTALFVAVQQSYLTRRHNRLSVRPHFTIDTNLQDSNFTASLVNNGLGPAIIKDFIVELEGVNTPCKNGKEIEIILEKILPKYSSITNYNAHIITLASGYTMAQNDSKVIMQAEFREKDRHEILNRLMKVKFTVQYESFYGDSSIFRTEKKHLTNK